jgi:transposase InsO family protein
MSKDRELSTSGKSGADNVRGDERWANFRFSIIGPLLAAPPDPGELRTQLAQLASKQWRHPITGAWVHFGASTIERWYYRAVREPKNPVGVLARKVRQDCGTHPSLNTCWLDALLAQYKQHRSWSYRLQADNLIALARTNTAWGQAPSYESIRRYMKAHGLFKQPRGKRQKTAGMKVAEARLDALEVRSYESAYVNALWHLDFHGGSLRVLAGNGAWVYPQLLGVLDDHSRLCAHMQWYLAETAENLVHGLCQAIEKRGLPRALMSDNGSAMIADETSQGLQRLSILHERTLPYSPYQNGKQEVFWAQVEGRLLAMLENSKDLSLAQLNEASLAWVEMEYNRKVHAETGQTPLARFLANRDVGRPSPSSEELRLAFTAQLSRLQRRSDGTLSVAGVRYELPSRYRHLTKVQVRFAAWDLSRVYLADPRSGQVLERIYPQDKTSNADGLRRSKEPLVEASSVAGGATSGDGMAPLLRQLIAQYAATGLPPAYLPKNEIPHERKVNHE